MKRFFFRVDASIQIGSGHVMRCLTLAKALREHGIQCSFVCREHEGHFGELIKKNGFELFLLSTEIGADLQIDSGLAHSSWLRCSIDMDAKQTRQVLPEKVDCLVVDHYALDARWESQMRSVCQKIVVIDDLADRKHDCDVLLDQNLGTTETDYSELVPAHCIKLIGPKFALLRPEFAEWREYSLQRRKYPELKNILISMGGVDKDNITGKILHQLSLSLLPDESTITVVMGTTAPWLEDIKSLAIKMPIFTKVLVNVENMAELIANCDFVIGAAGATAWERCCLGVPSLTMVIADNQKKVATALAKNKATILYHQSLTMEGNINLALDINKNKELSSVSAAIVDGLGANRVVNRVLYGYYQKSY